MSKASRHAWFLLVLFLFAPRSQATVANFGAKVAEFGRVVLQMVRDPARPRIYATTTANTVLVVNTETLQIDAEILIGSSPQGLDISPDGNRLYVANSGSTLAGIGVVDLTTLTALPSLPTTSAARQIAVGLNNHLYVVEDQLRQLDATTGAVQATFSGFGTSSPNASIYGGNLRITPDRKALFYGNTGLSPATLYAFDVSGSTPSPSQVTPFSTIGANGEDLILSADGSTICYAVGSGNDSYNIDLIPTSNINARIGSMNTGPYPDNGAFSPDGSLFYTAPDTQRVVQVFDTKTFLKTGSFQIDAYEPARLLCDSTGTLLFLCVNDDFDSAPATLRVYKVGEGQDPTLTSGARLTFHAGESGSSLLTASGIGITWQATGLPSGLHLDSATGIISGTPVSAGVYHPTLTITDAHLDASTVPVTIDVQTSFTLQIVGNGTVDGVVAGSSWQTIGDTLDLTANADPEGQFFSWSGGVSSTQSSISVTVADRMTVVANFQPLITITFAVNGPGTIAPGTQSIKRPVGAFVSVAAIANVDAHFVKWSGAVTSFDGELTFKVVANPMLLTANFADGAPATLTVNVQGGGQVTPGFLGITNHFVGDTITVAELSPGGTRFLSWSGDVESSSSLLRFTLTGDTTITANFEALSSYIGTYKLVGSAPDSTADRASLGIAVTKTGAFTATLAYGTEHVTFKGNFFSAAGWDATIPAKGSSPAISIHLDLPADQSVDSVTGTLSVGGSTQTLEGFRAGKFTSRNPAPERGSYTLLFPPNDAAGLAWGYGIAKVSATGAVTVSGKLGDGVALAYGTALSENSDFLIDKTLPGGKEFLQGRIAFVSSGQSDLAGTANWVRMANAKAASFPLGFAVSQSISGSREHAPSAGQNLLIWSSGSLMLSGGGLGTDLPSGATIGSGNQVTLTSSDPATAAKLSIAPKSSTFTGSFAAPGARHGVRTAFRGVIDYGTQTAVGQFSGPAGPGSAMLSPAP